MSKVTFQTYSNALESANKILKDLGAPSPEKPKEFDKKFEFPTDVSRLKIHELGNQMLMFAAFRSYCDSQLASLESSMIILSGVYEIILGYEMFTIQNEHTGGRLVKEQMIAAAIQENTILNDLWQRKLEREAVINSLKAKYRMFDQSYQALSRELARREIESRFPS